MDPTLGLSLSPPPGKSRSAPSSDERGFTLVEAVVALMVCTVGLVAMAELMAITIRMQQLGRNSTHAVRMAQEKVDELTTVTFAHATMACGGSLTVDQANHFDDGIVNNVGYHRRWVVSDAPDGANLRLVTVRVIPDVSDRRTASPFDLVTIIRGLGAACP
jgi:competence protein ComGC